MHYNVREHGSALEGVKFFGTFGKLKGKLFCLQRRQQLMHCRSLPACDLGALPRRVPFAAPRFHKSATYNPTTPPLTAPAAPCPSPAHCNAAPGRCAP